MEEFTNRETLLGQIGIDQHGEHGCIKELREEDGIRNVHVLLGLSLAARLVVYFDNDVFHGIIDTNNRITRPRLYLNLDKRNESK